MEVNQVDVLVVGAGPAGLAAAIRLKSLGVGQVWVVEREGVAGGVPRHCEHTGFGWRDLRRVMSGPGYAQRYVASAEKAGAKIHTGVTVTDWVGPKQVKVTSARGIASIKADAIVLATGCRERPRAARLVPGSRPDGVFTTGSLQRYAHDFNHHVGGRALVAGAEHVSYSAVHTLRKCGASVAGMVTSHPHHQSFPPYIRIAKGFTNFPLYTNCRISNLLGNPRLEAAEITDLRTGESRRIACDTVVFTGNWVPDQELARRGGLTLDAGTRGPQVDAEQRSSTAGVFAAGNLVHPGETADTAAISGRAAAGSVAAYLQLGSWRSEKQIGFEFDPDVVQWISPHVVEAGQSAVPHGHFILRVCRYLNSATLSILQGRSLLWQRKFRRLVPNLPYFLPDAFLRRVHPEGGQLQVRLENG